jgi:hypothetical protein
VNRRSPNDNWVKYNWSRWVKEHHLVDCAEKTIWLHLLSNPTSNGKRLRQRRFCKGNRSFSRANYILPWLRYQLRPLTTLLLTFLLNSLSSNLSYS